MPPVVRHPGFDQWVRDLLRRVRVLETSKPTAASLGAATALLGANNQTGTSYTLALTDASLVVECNNASAVTLTVPPNSSVAFDVGTVVEVYQQGAGQVTITAGSGVTLRAPNGAKTAAQYAVAAIWKRGTNEWVVTGDVET